MHLVQLICFLYKVTMEVIHIPEIQAKDFMLMVLNAI